MDSSGPEEEEKVCQKPMLSKETASVMCDHVTWSVLHTLHTVRHFYSIIEHTIIQNEPSVKLE